MAPPAYRRTHPRYLLVTELVWGVLLAIQWMMRNQSYPPVLRCSHPLR